MLHVCLFQSLVWIGVDRSGTPIAHQLPVLIIGPLLKGCVLQAVRETSQHFLPFGVYHFIHGTQIRTPHPPKSSAASHSDYAKHVCQHLDARHLLKIAYLTGFQTGGLMDHKVTSD